MSWFVDIRQSAEVGEGFSQSVSTVLAIAGVKSLAEGERLAYEKGVGRRWRRLILSGTLNGSQRWRARLLLAASAELCD